MQGEAETIATIDKTVSQYIDNQYGIKIIPIWKRLAPYAVAASLLLLCGTMYFWAKPKENNLANVTQSTENQIIKTDSIAPIEPNTLADNSDFHKEKAKITLEKASATAADRAITDVMPPIPQAEMMQSEEATSAAQPSVAASKEIVIAPAKEQKEVTFTPNANYPTEDKAVLSKAKKSYAQPDLLRKGTAFYQTNNFAEAVKVFKEILANEPNNQSALFYLGLSEQGRGFYQNAIDPFSKIDSNNQNYNEAQFQLALSYLKINKLAKAKAILKVLSESENPRQKEALRLLKQ